MIGPAFLVGTGAGSDEVVCGAVGRTAGSAGSAVVGASIGGRVGSWSGRCCSLVGSGTLLGSTALEAAFSSAAVGGSCDSGVIGASVDLVSSTNTDPFELGLPLDRAAVVFVAGVGSGDVALGWLVSATSDESLSAAFEPFLPSLLLFCFKFEANALSLRIDMVV